MQAKRLTGTLAKPRAREVRLSAGLGHTAFGLAKQQMRLDGNTMDTTMGTLTDEEEYLRVPIWVKATELLSCAANVSEYRLAFASLWSGHCGEVRNSDDTHVITHAECLASSVQWLQRPRSHCGLTDQANRRPAARRAAPACGTSALSDGLGHYFS
jgi:hypothetical protein